MGEIIQIEGVAYKLVDRKAKEGDVVIAQASENSDMKAGEAYLVHARYGAPAVNVGSYHVNVYSRIAGRTEDTVDVYEEVKDYNYAEQPVPVPESEYERTKRHLDHPFYKEAHECWHLTQNGQIRKGAEKYPEPFNPANWTIYELMEHAMQENVDQAHYIYGMYTKMYEMEKELQELRTFRDQVHKTVVKWGAMNEPESGNA